MAAQSALYTALINMLADLCNDAESAGRVFEMVRYRHDVMSWQHMRDIVDNYVTRLCPDPSVAASGNDAGADLILATDLLCLLAIVRLLRRAAAHSAEVAVHMMNEWAVTDQLLRLLVSVIPHQLKAAIMLALAAFAKDPNIAGFLWSQVEATNMVKGYVCVRACVRVCL